MRPRHQVRSRQPHSRHLIPCVQFHPVWTPAKARTGRSRSLLGRRRLLIAGTALFAASSLACGLAGSQGLLVGARLAQGFGAAMMSPAALSILTPTFQDSDRHKALAVWAGISGRASPVRVVLGRPPPPGF